MNQPQQSSPSPQNQLRMYHLKNSLGMEAKISNFGGTMNSLFVPFDSGQKTDVVLGFPEDKDLLENPSSMGVIVGRYGNRIANGRFELEGKEYQLAQNLKGHHLHGGDMGFQRRYWQAENWEGEGNSLTLTRLSEDGEDGYPGSLSAKVTFTLTDQMSLQIDYVATTDAPTIVNLTHHAYFNLAGEGSILDHELWLLSDHITEVDASLIPTGAIIPVQNTPFDFRAPRFFRVGIKDAHPQIKYGSGYDHNFVLKNWDGSLRHFATVTEPRFGHWMKAYTTEPGVQLYTGNHLSNQVGKYGHIYQAHSGFCLETQHYPDSPNQADFPTTVLRPGEVYQQTTTYEFGSG